MIYNNTVSNDIRVLLPFRLLDCSVQINSSVQLIRSKLTSNMKSTKRSKLDQSMISSQKLVAGCWKASFTKSRPTMATSCHFGWVGLCWFKTSKTATLCMSGSSAWPCQHLMACDKSHLSQSHEAEQDIPSNELQASEISDHRHMLQVVQGPHSHSRPSTFRILSNESGPSWSHNGHTITPAAGFLILASETHSNCIFWAIAPVIVRCVLIEKRPQLVFTTA